MRSTIKAWFIAVMCTLNVHLSAQEFLVSGGLNLSKLYVTVDGENYSGNMRIQPGFKIGGYYELPIGYRYSFVPGIALSLRGIKEKGDVVIEEEKYDYVMCLNVLYADVPIMFRRYFGPVGQGYFINFGCQFGYGIHAWEKDKIKVGSVTAKEVYKVNFDEISQFDSELVIGWGVKFARVDFGIQYEMGLVNVLNGLPSNVGARHSVIAIYGSYYFPKK